MLLDDGRCCSELSNIFVFRDCCSFRLLLFDFFLLLFEESVLRFFVKSGICELFLSQKISKGKHVAEESVCGWFAAVKEAPVVNAYRPLSIRCHLINNQ